MRCKHQNGRLIEVMTATHVRDVECGVLEGEGINDMGNITHYEYQCRDCKRWWRYQSSGQKHVPMWLRHIHEQL